MPVFKNEDNGTWYVMARYVNWKGERKQKCKRGFATKKEAQEWERMFQLQTSSDLDMSFEAFTELYIKDERSGIAQKRCFASPIHQRQRKEYAENRLQERIDRHARNRIDPQQHRPNGIRNRRKHRQIEQHRIREHIGCTQPSAGEQTDDHHHRAAEHKLPSAHHDRAVVRAELLNQSRAACAGKHRNDDEALADEAHPAGKPVLRPVDDHDARHAD